MDQREDEFEDVLEMARSLLGDDADELLEANDLVSAALTQRSDDWEAWLVKSQVLSALGDDTAALAAIEMALRCGDDNAEVHYWRAAVLSDLSRPTDALRSIDRAFRSLGSEQSWLLEDLYSEKAAILEGSGRIDEALRAYEAGLAHCPESLLLKAGVEPLRRSTLRARFKVLRGGLA